MGTFIYFVVVGREGGGGGSSGRGDGSSPTEVEQVGVSGEGTEEV